MLTHVLMCCDHTYVGSTYMHRHRQPPHAQTQAASRSPAQYRLSSICQATMSAAKPGEISPMSSLPRLRAPPLHARSSVLAVVIAAGSPAVEGGSRQRSGGCVVISRQQQVAAGSGVVGAW
jgi:hypothetical protein